MPVATWPQWILGIILILSALGVITLRKPVHASLSFLLTLVMLAGLYLQLSAEFIAVMQILVYAGAILVIFMFVIILFQDAHDQIEKFKSNCSYALLVTAITAFSLALAFIGIRTTGISSSEEAVKGFGTVQSLGNALYIDYFFPFEVVILLFLIALVGGLYIAKRSRN